MKKEEILAKVAAGEISPEEAGKLLEAAEKRPRGTLYCKVSQKGAVSVYGLQRMPVTLYVEQWDRLLNFGDELRQFIAEHDALQSRRDRAGVGDVVAQVRAVVDAGDDQVGLEAVDQPERRQPHAVDRRPVARVADRAVVERHLGHPQRAPERDRARRRRLVGVGRDHRELDVVEGDQRPPEARGFFAALA